MGPVQPNRAQVEGLVADYDLTLGDLIGTIKTFFQRIGEWVLASCGPGCAMWLRRRRGERQSHPAKKYYSAY